MERDYLALYESNADFREYVDKYCYKYIEGNSISIKEALTHKMVKNYAEWLFVKGE